MDALAYYGGHLVTIRWLQDRSAEMVDVVEALACSPTMAQADLVHLAAAASLAADAGQLDRARATLDRLLAHGLDRVPRSSTWAMTLYAVADAAHVLGNAATAASVYRLLSPFADLPVMPSLAVVCLGSTHRPLGLAALTVGDVDRRRRPPGDRPRRQPPARQPAAGGHRRRRAGRRAADARPPG